MSLIFGLGIENSSYYQERKAEYDETETFKNNTTNSNVKVCSINLHTIIVHF
jgi:hypothetical protein